MQGERSIDGYISWGKVEPVSDIILVVRIYYREDEGAGCTCINCGAGVIHELEQRIRHSFTKEKGYRIAIACSSCGHVMAQRVILLVQNEEYN